MSPVFSLNDVRPKIVGLKYIRLKHLKIIDIYLKKPFYPSFT